MADMNEDKMKAKVPLWFQKILGWESRLLVRLEKCKRFFGPVLCCFVESVTHTRFARGRR